MRDLQYLEKFQKGLESLTNNRNVILGCMEILKSDIVTSLDKTKLTKEDVEVLEWIKDTPNLISNGLTYSLNQMACQVRERSHGAVSLDYIVASTKLYDELVTSLGLSKKTVCKFGGVPIYSNEYVKDNYIYGIGKSKFQFVPCGNLIFLCEINKG